MIVGYEDLSALAGTVAMVDGCFDPLHAGHLEYFREAAALGVPLLCNVQSDDYIVRTKSRANLLPEDERALLLDSLRDVAYVHVCRTSTADVLQRLEPHSYVKGADWRGRLPDEQTKLCERQGTRIVFLDTVTGSSTVTVSDFLDRNAEASRAGEPDPTGGDVAEDAYTAVVTSHVSEYLSGVARFNRMLAERLGVGSVGLEDVADSPGPLLLSVKLSDSDESARAAAERAVDALAERGTVYDVFLHGFDGTPAETRLLSSARRVFAGNDEIAAMTAHLAPTVALWCPELIDPGCTLRPAGLTLFSFGMAHKVRVDRFTALRDTLDGLGVDYALRMSTAFHEKAGLGDIDRTSEGLRELFGDRLQLLGFLSDAAVNHFLGTSDLCVAFFPRGVRANNTSVLGAMAAGKAVLTNLDGYSPAWMRHGENVLDLGDLRAEDLAVEAVAALGARASRDVAAHAGWEPLVERLKQTAGPVASDSQGSGGASSPMIDVPA